MPPDFHSAVHPPLGSRSLSEHISRANSSVLAGPRAQIRLISGIQSAGEGETVLGPWHTRVNASCLSVRLLASVAEVESPDFIAMSGVQKSPRFGLVPA